MCYHVSLTKSADYLEERFGARFEQPSLFNAVYHSSGLSTPYHPVVSNENPDSISFFQWGLVPFWVKDDNAARQIRLRTLNARAETIHKKPAFRHAISAKRCLVLADGFYEWQEFNKKRYPYYISLADHSAFALAGIWDRWLNENTGETKNTFSIITTDANSLLQTIHNTRTRVPVILERANERKWLIGDLGQDEIDSMLKPYGDKEMLAHTVSRLISTKRTDTNTPEVMKPFPYPELEP